MSIETYSIGVNVDQSGMNTGTELMINTLNQATEKMIGSMNQLSQSINATMSNISNTMNRVSGEATSNMKNNFNEMSNSISNKMTESSNAVASSTNQMTSSMNSVRDNVGKVKSSMDTMADSTSKSSNEHVRFSNSMRQSSESANLLARSMSTLQKHMEWLAAGGVMAAFIEFPHLMIETAAETETLTQKMRQNLELAPQYHNNNELLSSDLKQLQQNAQTFAVGYGASLEEVMEAMQILSRRFKDVNAVTYLTSAALTMNKLDFVDLKKAASDLEAVMLQFGLNAKQTQGFLNDFSVAVHVARVTGSELLDALQRSGSGFKQFNMGSREAIAAVAALSTETARTGSTIGNSFKSITANFSMEKAIAALDAYNIKIYEINENGTKTMREGANVFKELQDLFAKLDDEGRAKLSLAIAGGKFQVNAMQAFLADAGNNFTDILNQMKEKSSTAMTDTLMAAGMDTFAVKMASAKASLQVFSQNMGGLLLPRLKQVLDGFTALTLGISQHMKTIDTCLDILKVLLGVYVAVKVVAIEYALAEGAVALAVGVSNIAFALRTGTVALATEGTWALNLSNIAATASTVAMTFATEGLSAGFTMLWASMGPIGWAVTAVTLLSVAAYELYNNWQPVLTWFKETWDSVINFVAEHINFLILLCPVLIDALYVLAQDWSKIGDSIKEMWKSVTKFMGECSSIICDAIIPDVIKAFLGFEDGVGQALSNIWDRLCDWAYNLLPQWGRDVLNFFANMASGIANATRAIGEEIKAGLTTSSELDRNDEMVLDGGPGESNYQRAQRMAEEALANAITSQAIPEMPSGGTGEIGNQIPERKGKKGSGKSRSNSSNDEYHEAKRAYEADIADEDISYADKIAMYKSYLAGKAADEKEEADYEKGLHKLELASAKETRDIKMAQLDLEIAEGKDKNKEYYQSKIDILKSEVALTREGSLERVQAEIKVAQAKHELLVQQRTEEAHLEDQRKIKALETLATVDFTQKEALKLYQTTQKEYDSYLVESEDRRYAMEKESLEKKIKIYEGNAKEVGKIQTEIDTLTKKHVENRLKLEKDLYNEIHKYQLSGLEGTRKGLTDALNSINAWDKSASNIFKDFGKTVFNSFADVWIKGVVDNTSKGLAKMFGLVQTDKTRQTATEQTKQAALTSVVTAGETARLAATKTAMAAASAAGAASANAMVGTNIAAFTALLSMIESTAASISTIMPMGPGIAAAITAGVTASTATLTAAGTAATATIAGLAVPSFDVGAWKLGKDQLAMVHEGETILPKQPAQQFRDYVAGNDLSGVLGSRNNQGQDSQGKTTINLYASTVDPKNLKKTVKSLGGDMVDVLNRQKRNFNVGKKSKGW